MKQKKWKSSKDPLFRGDGKDSVRQPTPSADDSLVRHIMYFEGPGRNTPYLSTSEVYDSAEKFATGGTVWATYVSVVVSKGVGHISNADLLHALKGNGKGRAKWEDAHEVMQARRYVEQWSEHLLDFRSTLDVPDAVTTIFKKK